MPLDLLDPFSTADIGFQPYPPQKLEAFAEQLKEEGLMVRIIVRPKANGRYEILAGHNRVGAARLAGWSTIAVEIVEADDIRAIVIATSTNFIQRQQLSIVERGKAYKVLEEGYMWGRILELLARKAKAGVDVRVLYDGTCEITTLSHDYPERLKKLGIRAKMYAPMTPLLSSHYSYRDHRKILVIDGKVALHIPLLLILPMVMENKVLAVALSAPVSDVLSVVATLLFFAPGFYHTMKSSWPSP